ncbi:MAG: Fe2+ or Zn2+ uptake regulation protein [Maritalea sp.]|jgi:Fe2+ or Zn2+ uptake regulation protein
MQINAIFNTLPSALLPIDPMVHLNFRNGRKFVRTTDQHLAICTSCGRIKSIHEVYAELAK